MPCSRSAGARPKRYATGGAREGRPGDVNTWGLGEEWLHEKIAGILKMPGYSEEEDRLYPGA